MTFLAALFVLGVVVVAFMINGFLDKRAYKKQKARQRPTSGSSQNTRS